jgi:hypothetical protein
MRLMDSSKGPPRAVDFTPLLLATVLAFVIVATFQFLRDLPGAERGLLLFERACPIHSDTDRPLTRLSVEA